MGSLSLVQGIFPTPGLNPGLPHCKQIPYQLSYQGSPSHRTEVFISQNPKTLKASLWTGVTLLSPTGASRSTWEALLVLWVERPHCLGSWMIHGAFCESEGLKEGQRSKRKHVSFLTSGPLLIPQIHRMPRGSSMIPNSVVFPPTERAGPPRYSWRHQWEKAG